MKMKLAKFGTLDNRNKLWILTMQKPIDKVAKQLVLGMQRPTNI